MELFDLSVITGSLPEFWRGLWMTLQLTGFALLFGFFAAIPLAVLRLWRHDTLGQLAQGVPGLRPPVALREAVFPQRLQHILGQLQKPELICHRRLGLAYAPRRLLLTHTEHAYELAYAVGLLDKIQIPPLEVLDQRRLHLLFGA